MSLELLEFKAIDTIKEAQETREPEKYDYILANPPVSSVSDNRKEMAQNLLDALLYTIFGEIEEKKNLYFESKEQEPEHSKQFERLVPEARKLIQDIS